MTNIRVNEIDLLRLLAALAVVFFHYSFRGFAADGMSDLSYPLLSPFFKYGYLGVELFFMISGFVIMMSAASGSLRGFMISRFVRLYPAFWACCTITFVVTIAIGGSRYSASMSQYLINMTMLSGLIGVPPIDGSYWSLFVELKFYALVAIVLLIGRIHQAQLFLIFWLMASIVLEFLPVDMLRHLLTVHFSGYFIAGATFFLMMSQGVSLTRVGMLFLSWCLAVYEAINDLPKFEEHFNTDMSRYVVTVIITTFFLVMLLIALRRTGFFGRNRWLLAGTLTYPLYLLHQNIGFMVFNIAYPAINPHLLFWGAIAAALGAACVVNILVERRYAQPMKVALNNLIDAIHRLVTGTH